MIAIEFISVLGLPPVEFVQVAQEIGCRRIGIALEPIVRTAMYPSWSLRDDSALRQQTIAALRDCAVSVSLGEGFLALPNKDMRDSAADLDLMCELGAGRVNLVSIDPDLARAIEQCGLFAELAHSRGLEATLEFMPGLPIGSLESALAVVHQVGKANFRLLIDAMHFFRSGSSLATLATLGSDAIGYAQLCDVPLVCNDLSYADEARYARLPPGEGELPLAGFLNALPRDVDVGLEVPMREQAEAGIGPRERLTACLNAAAKLMT
jgi:sugar phosphate isomerase/epimerase